jgi:hypothetical protein
MKKSQKNNTNLPQRRMFLETLEDRRLLAGVPVLAGIQTNNGDLLSDGDVLNVAPQELLLNFNQDAEIDPTSFTAVYPSAASATVTITDYDSLNPGNKVILRAANDPPTDIEFVVSGALGGTGWDAGASNTEAAINLASLIDADVNFKASANSGVVNITQSLDGVVGNTIVDLEPAPPTPAFDKTDFTGGVDGSVATLSTASSVTILRSGGDGNFNVASATSHFGTGGVVDILFESQEGGTVGNDIEIIVSKSDHNNASKPTVTVDESGTIVFVDLNTNAGNTTTARSLIDALNDDAAASSLIRASLLEGDGATDITAAAIDYSPIVLSGSNDVVIEAGYVGVDESARQIVFRFREALIDETYQISVQGTGAVVLRDVDGSVFLDGEDNFTSTFQLDLGPQIEAVVPQPIVRDPALGLQQLKDTIHVYFNEDNLDSSLAEDREYYPLIFTNDTVENTDDEVYFPTEVEYSPGSDLVVLKYASDLDELAGAGDGTFRLRIGAKEYLDNNSLPFTPIRLNLDLIGDAATSYDTGMAIGKTMSVSDGKTMLVSGDGVAAADGTGFTITDVHGGATPFEFDGGVILQIPDGSLIAEGDNFEIGDGTQNVIFEFDSDSSTLPSTDVAINYTGTETAEEMANLVSNAFASTGLNVESNELSLGEIHLGWNQGLSVDLTNATGLQQEGNTTLVDAGARTILVINRASFAVSNVADAISSSINTAGNSKSLQPSIAAQVAGDSRIALVAVDAITASTVFNVVADGDGVAAADGTGFTITDVDDTDTPFEFDGGVILQIPDGSLIAEGDNFEIGDGAQNVIFEFDSDSSTLPSTDVAITYTGTETAEEMANLVANAFASTGLNVESNELSLGEIHLGWNQGLSVDLTNATGLQQEGNTTLVDAGARRILVINRTSFAARNVADAISSSINAAGNSKLHASRVGTLAGDSRIALVGVKAVTASTILTVPAGGFQDGDIIEVTNGSQSSVFEFDNDGDFDNSNTQIDFTGSVTPEEFAVVIADSLETSVNVKKATHLGGGVISVLLVDDYYVNELETELVVEKSPAVFNVSVFESLIVQGNIGDDGFDPRTAIPNPGAEDEPGHRDIRVQSHLLVGGAYLTVPEGGFQEGDTIEVTNGLRRDVFEFDSDGILSTHFDFGFEIFNIATPFSGTETTPEQFADLLAGALTDSGAVYSATHQGGGVISVLLVEDYYVDGLDTGLIVEAAPAPRGGVTTLDYSFPAQYGFDPLGNTLLNAITENQKQRAREIFEMYGQALGLTFVETDAAGLKIVTGDMRAIAPTIPIGLGGVLGAAQFGGNVGMGIMDLQDFQNAEDDEYGGRWFDTAFHEIGHLLGYGHTDGLPPFTVMNSDLNLGFGQTIESRFPGDHDVSHGQYMYGVRTGDLDLYEIDITEEGTLDIETFAERLADVSLLDTAVSVFRDVLAMNANGSRIVVGKELVARNDDYFSEDSKLTIDVTEGHYYIGVSSTGNNSYDPVVEGTGQGGKTQGHYELRLVFSKSADDYITDTSGVDLDADGDGAPGGTLNTWFNVTETDDIPVGGESRTLFVDKTATATGNGSISSPYTNLNTAMAAAAAGDIVRVVGNVGADGDAATLQDNQAYELGYNPLSGVNLPDGDSLVVKRGVTLMVDAGVIVKSRRARIARGSDSSAVDLSGGAIQLLGTPRLLDINGSLLTDANGDIVPGEIYLTSLFDKEIGLHTTAGTDVFDPTGGDWGGIDLRDSVDAERAGVVLDSEKGEFLDLINHVTIHYGGGLAVVGGSVEVISPIDLDDTLPTIVHNTIQYSASAAISATPNSFIETRFSESKYQAAPFTPDYARVGPEMFGNTIVDNSINGVLLKIDTPAGGEVNKVDVAARFDDTDIVHVITENLILNNGVGGPIQTDVDAVGNRILKARYDSSLVIDPGTVVKLDGARIDLTVGTLFLMEGNQNHKAVLTSVRDIRYGAGGSFNTTNQDGSVTGSRGDWSGVYASPFSNLSVDHAVVAYGGGISRIEGTFAAFNVIEIHDANARITRTRFEHNETGNRIQDLDRNGRGVNGRAVIFVTGDQPVIADNTILQNSSVAISIGVNDLNYEFVQDHGPQTSNAQPIEGRVGNQGPLIQGNLIGNNFINGMLVRGGTLTTEGVWDDTDIVHVLQDQVHITDFHTFGGLRLQSSSSESLVVKLEGAFESSEATGEVTSLGAGFRASGRPSDIDDRIGGLIQIVGQPRHPVILTSILDCTAGAGFTPDGAPNLFTKNDECLEPGTEEIPVGKSGAVIIDGGDRDDHGSLDVGPDGFPGTADDVNRDGWLFIEQMMNFAMGGNLNNAANDVIAIGITAGGARNGFEAAANKLGFNFVYANGPAITSAVFTDYKLMYIPSTVNNTSGGISQGDNDLLAARKDDVKDFVNNGGSLVALTQESALVAYPWLELPLPFEINGFGTGGISNPLRKTQAAIDAGLTISDVELSRGDPYHNEFTGPLLPLAFNGLKPFVLDDGPDGVVGNADDRVITLGLASGSFGIGVVPPVVSNWNSVQLAQFSHDRNVGVVVEREFDDHAQPIYENFDAASSQFVGQLAVNQFAGNELARLGFEIQGTIETPTDQDLYRFEAAAGTEIWLDIDRTEAQLDTVVELLDNAGRVLYRSDNSGDASAAQTNPNNDSSLTLTTEAQPLSKSVFGVFDNGTTNAKDAGMRLLLPGALGQINTYHVRVLSADQLLGGSYELQIRLQELDETPGSAIQFADIRYAKAGIEIIGLPLHSPLAGEVAENIGGFGNDTANFAQELGNLLQTDRSVVSVAGSLSAPSDVDFYAFDVSYENVTLPRQTILGNLGSSAESNDILLDATAINFNGLSGTYTATQAEIGDNSTLVGNLNRDVDILQISVSAGSLIRVNTNTDAYGNQLNTIARIFDANGIELAISDNDPGPGELPGTDSYLEFTVDVDGDYFIGISGLGNGTYDPTDMSTRLGGSTGRYDLQIDIDEPAGFARRLNNRVNLPNALNLSNDSALIIEGSVGVSSDVAVTIHSGMTSEEVAARIQIALANTFAGGELGAFKRYGSVIRMIGHTVDDRGPLGLTETMPGDEYGNFESNRRGQDSVAGDTQRSSFEGVYIDDIIIGFAERGEMVTGANNDDSYVANLRPRANQITTGEYQLEIRQGTQHVDYAVDGTSPFVARTWDSNDRLGNELAIDASAGFDIVEGVTYTISDGYPHNEVTFEFDDDKIDDGVAAGNVEISFDPSATEEEIALLIRDAINNNSTLAGAGIVAGFASGDNPTVTPTDNKINLYGTVIVDVDDPMTVLYSDTGDENASRQQGQVIISQSFITNSTEFGISIVSTVDDENSNLHQGPVRVGREINTFNLLPGVVITDNLLVNNALGGISLSGYQGVPFQPVPVPFARIINNTIVGSGVGTGIQISNNASPTLLNNIVADLELGIDIDGSSSTTVIGGMVFANNVTDATGTKGEFAIEINTIFGEPLFQDAARGNYYLAAGSLAIDSAIDSIMERDEMHTLQAPLGIADSPIIVSNYDALGQRRVDDPSVATPTGIGHEVFKDRGAIDRADFIGPQAVIIDPLDNTPPDSDPADTIIEIRNQDLDVIAIQLIESENARDLNGGAGVLDSSVQAGAHATATITITNFPNLIAGDKITLRGTSSPNLDVDFIVTAPTGSGLEWEASTSNEFTAASLARVIDADGRFSASADEAVVTIKQSIYGATGNTIVDTSIASTAETLDKTDFNGGGDGSVSLFKDGVRLEPRIDYTFEYDATNDIIRLLPLSGKFPVASTYRVELTASRGIIIQTQSGELIDDGEMFTIVDKFENSTTFEFESGYSMQVPVAYTLTVPELGGSGILDGEFFTITSSAGSQIFEFDRDIAVQENAVRVVYTVADDADELAQSISDALASADIGLAPHVRDDGEVHVGSSSEHTLSTTNTVVTQRGVVESVLDGEFITVDNGSDFLQMEFDTDSTTLPETTKVIAITPGLDNEQIANEIINAIKQATLGLSPTHVEDGRIHVGGDRLTVLDSSNSSVVQFDESGTRPELGLRIPSRAGVPFGLVDGEVFSISLNATTIVFELDNDATTTAGNLAITFNDTSTLDQIANKIVSQVQLSALELTASNLGDGFVELADSTFLHSVVVGSSGLTQVGLPGDPATVAVNYSPFESFDEQDVAVAIATSINGTSTLEGVTAIALTDSVIVSGAANVSGIVVSLVAGIEDRAGNALYPNQLTGETSFEINLTSGLDWGDASDGYPVTSAENGANHLVADGFYLGSSVDIENDGTHSELYDADDTDGSPDDEDGVINIDELIDLKPGRIYKLQVEVNGIGPQRPGFVDAWVDFNHDDSWDGFTGDDPNSTTDPAPQVFVSEKLEFFSTVDAVDPVTGEPTAISGAVTIVNGLNDLYFTVPPQAQSFCPSLRIRLSSEGDLLPTGPASDGEVEDYQLFTHSSDWHNTAISEDVNKDGFVTPIDALLVINYIGVNVGPGKLLPDGQLPPRSPADIGIPPLVDVNDDGFVAPIDALRVVNFINLGDGEGEAEGEGEDALMMNYGVTQVTVTSTSIVDLVEPVASAGVVDIPVMASPERVREAQFAELDLSRENSLDAVLADIGAEVSDLRDIADGHDEFFASIQY